MALRPPRRPNSENDQMRASIGHAEQFTMGAQLRAMQDDDYATAINNLISGGGVPPAEYIRALEATYGVVWLAAEQRFRNCARKITSADLKPIPASTDIRPEVVDLIDRIRRK